MSCVMAVLAATRPQSKCTLVGAAMLTVSLHAAYLVVVRPYKQKLELICSTANALLQVAMCILLVAALNNGTYLGPLGWCLLVLEGSFFAQSVVLAFWRYYVHSRRETLALLTDGTSRHNPLDASLLQMPTDGNSSG